ncbi:SC16A-like protein [Mya arenaria]|uniref:Protein transport protein sec16 n=1 Tax=Mya arenaria TaxID=6604 RepID=A0ABY7GD10_MYAAR|nr:SC16A-like protein [Mya arenaria]
MNNFAVPFSDVSQSDANSSDQRPHNELDNSLSTEEESQSTAPSLGNIEGGVTDVSYNNEDYDEDSDDSDESEEELSESHVGSSSNHSAGATFENENEQNKKESHESGGSWPPTQESYSKESIEEQPESQPQATTTPTFSDWELVPNSEVEQPLAAQLETPPVAQLETPHVAQLEMPPSSVHSRNASIDNNVKFFISSNNSSARGSPSSTGKATEDDLLQEHENKVTNPRIQKPVNKEIHDNIAKSEVAQISAPPPPMAGSGPKGGNPFRKGKLEVGQEDVSLLSSTQLDVTKPNYENSPVVLNQSISPIMGHIDQNKMRDQSESPDLNDDKPQGNITDTPVSSQSKKTIGNVKQSPIMPRKESAFQPLKQEGKNKPVKASHEIPGIAEQEQKSRPNTGKPSSGERRGRYSPDMDNGRGRRTPEWESQDRQAERKGGSEYDKKYGRRTPDWDSSQRKGGRRSPDREKDRYGRSSDGDKLTSRPPAGPYGGDKERDRPSRSRQSAFHHIHVSRGKNNVSPAASLLDVADAPAMPNILLMPVASAAGTGNNTNVSEANAPLELNPIVSLISSMSEHIKSDDVEDGKDNSHSRKKDDDDRDKSRKDKERYRDKDSSERERYRDDRDYRDSRDRDRYRDRDRDRDGIRGNHSYDSLRDRNLKDSRATSREQLSMYDSRTSLDQDDSRDRGKRVDSKERRYRDDHDKYRDRDRPSSRGSILDSSSRRDYRDRDRDRDREYYRRDRYDRDRPKSRQGERDRPVSRIADSERPRSRNDYDKDYRDRTRGYDYDEYYRRAPREYYDQRYYDYYYGTYDQSYYGDQSYYQDVPRYPDPYQRRPRTGTPGSLSDGGQEIFDYPPEIYDYSRSGYEDYYGYEQNGYRWDPHVSAWVETTTEVIPQRQTPEKFMIPHMRACFGPNGQLVKVLPNRPADGQPATVEIHSVQTLLDGNEEAEELEEYPGPLVRGDTHKNDVLNFCQQKAKMCVENMDLQDRDSAELIWRFLELLIKQNGTVVGTDIADLILQGHEPTTLEYRRSGMKITPSVDALDADDGESEDSSRLSRGTTPVDRALVNKGRSVEECTDRFRHLLMYGRKKDALDWAMKNNLWGHALFLASKMNHTAHANVMMRFANVAMRMNDPLQTVYQLMSGRQPAAVTCVTEERWGDWRPHLAMILSNNTAKPDLDRKCIMTLGDTLASKGFLHASHFCYLMSQISFGSFNKKSSKIVLIGSSHGLPLEYFATNEAIQCTEIYEYARSLANTWLNLNNFQTFKFLYATRLADYGYAQDLSSQLKFSDPQLEDSEDEQDPDWLRSLHTTLEGAIQSHSGTVTPAYLGGRTTASSDSGEVGMYMQQPDQQGQGMLYLNSTSGVYSQDSQYQHQPGYEGGQESQYQHQPGYEGHTQAYQAPDGSHQNHFDQGQVTQGTGQEGQTMDTTGYYQQPGADNQYQYQQDPSFQHQEADGANYGQTQWQDHQALTNHSTGTEPTNEEQAPAEVANQQQAEPTHPEYANTGEYHNYVPNHWSHGHQRGQPNFPADVNLGESQTSAVSGQSTQSGMSNKRNSIASESSVTPDEGEDHTDSNAGYVQQPSIFDLQPAGGRIVAPKLRPRTISESSTGSGPRDRHPSGPGSKSQKTADNGKDPGLGGKQKASGGGLLSKIGGLFSRKNEMKLPDDKEPSIVWDPNKKRWVDKNADEVEEAPALPPPKDHELSTPGPQPQSQPTNPGPAAPGPAPTPSNIPSGGNKFSRKNSKGFGARKQYVDVLNPNPGNSTNVPSSLFHTLPNSKSAPAIFNPMSLNDGSSESQDSIPEEESSSGADYTNQQAKPAGHQQLAPVQENVPSEPGTNSGGGSSMPAMFNPTQFQPANQAFKQPAPPAPGHRLSSRRVYPKR